MHGFMVTDYDCWHPDHENVDVQQVIKVLLGNAAKAKNMIKNLIDNFENHIDSKDPTNNCLDVAIITAPEKNKKNYRKIKYSSRKSIKKMKKLLLILMFLVASNTVYANGKILKSGFITKSASVKEGMNVDDPKNKIIIIYNHGQNSNDKAHKNEHIWVNQIKIKLH